MRNLNRVGLALVLAIVAAPAFATGPDFTDLLSAVDFSTVTSAILAVGALIVVPYVVWKGTKMVLRAIRGL